MPGEMVPVAATDGRSFAAYSAVPDTPNGAGLVILPEVYNVNRWVRGLADHYAGMGYAALVPDLFWRQEPGAHSDYTDPERARALGAAIDVDAGVGDVGCCAALLRGRLGTSAGVGVIGFCLGGRLAFLAGIRQPVDAVVTYYAVQLDRHLDEAPRLARPTVMHFAGTDPWAPPETVDALRRLYAGRDDVAIHVYPGTGHGFARNGYPPHDHAAADLAEQRTLQLLERVLPDRAEVL